MGRKTPWFLATTDKGTRPPSSFLPSPNAWVPEESPGFFWKKAGRGGPYPLPANLIPINRWPKPTHLTDLPKLFSFAGCRFRDPQRTKARHHLMKIFSPLNSPRRQRSVAGRRCQLGNAQTPCRLCFRQALSEGLETASLPRQMPSVHGIDAAYGQDWGC